MPSVVSSTIVFEGVKLSLSTHGTAVPARRPVQKIIGMRGLTYLQISQSCRSQGRGCPHGPSEWARPAVSAASILHTTRMPAKLTYCDLDRLSCLVVVPILYCELQTNYTLLPLALKNPSQKSKERNSSKFSGSRPAKSSLGIFCLGSRAQLLLHSPLSRSPESGKHYCGRSLDLDE